MGREGFNIGCVKLHGDALVDHVQGDHYAEAVGGANQHTGKSGKRSSLDSYFFSHYQIAVGGAGLEVQPGPQSFDFEIRKWRWLNFGSDKRKHAGNFQHPYFLAQADLYEKIAGEQWKFDNVFAAVLPAVNGAV
jgi:hypothetical protein